MRNILLIHWSLHPRLASCEDPDGPDEEWAGRAAMEATERIATDQLPVLSQNAASGSLRRPTREPPKDPSQSPKAVEGHNHTLPAVTLAPTTRVSRRPAHSADG
jgi:hypothetical protein